MPLRCLIVDDHLHFADGARRLLERTGIAVLATAATGADACSLARKLKPDLVLLDIDLGAESGFDVARQLGAGRSHGGAADGPDIILMSAHDPDDFAELIAESPVAGFLPKSALSAQAIRDLLG
ncbi:MAG: putative transcriptional regulator [Pseudonocardiales bacterium]|nr:putative transcriptional regulator [Pseudonocardiales bacterium]